MNGKGAAFLQYTQRFTEKSLFIYARNVVINIIACNRIKILVRIIQLAGVALMKFCILNSLRF